MSDQSTLIRSRNTLKCKYCYTCSIPFVPLCTHRRIWTAPDRDSINLCYNKGQRLAVSSTQLRSRGMIDVSLHSTSAWKEALSKQIACSQNISCVLNCPKTLIFFGNMKWSLHSGCRIRRHRCPPDQCWNCVCSVVDGSFAVSHTGLYLREEKAPRGSDTEVDGTLKGQLVI